jgi:hypothetical protein
MRIALVNPRWRFEGSIYFGCRAPHLPLELGYSAALLRAAGHEVEIVDAQLFDLADEDVRARVAALRPAMTVVATAPSYLFWRCPPPELRVPMATIEAVRDVAGEIALIGPHGSSTPRAALRKTRADLVVMGEPEATLPRLAAGEPRAAIPSIAYARGDSVLVQGGPAHRC